MQCRTRPDLSHGSAPARAKGRGGLLSESPRSGPAPAFLTGLAAALERPEDGTDTRRSCGLARKFGHGGSGMITERGEDLTHQDR